jgi:hypothetical protein
MDLEPNMSERGDFIISCPAMRAEGQTGVVPERFLFDRILFVVILWDFEAVDRP